MQDNGTRPDSRPQHTAAKLRKDGRPVGVPFKKGDARINRRGRPKNFDQFRALAQDIASGMIVTQDGQRMSVGESILREWAESDEPQLQRAFIEYAFGKVPDKF